MKKAKTIFIVATCIALASQVHINLFVPGFIITLSVIIMPILLYFNRELNPLKLTVAIGLASPVYRGFLLYISGTSTDQVLRLVFTDIIFYFVYGLIYYMLYWKRVNANLTNFFVTVFICDFVSNVLEISIMLKFHNYTYDMFQDLAIIAFTRTTIAIFVIMLFKYYSFLLVREEHEERYRNLIFITSNVKSEVYFMNKNKTDIENIMKKAYYLYKILSENGYPEELANISLDVAKDVHDIKKDYASVIKGLEDMFDEKKDNVRMDMKDITGIIEADVKEYIRRNKLDIEVDFKIYDNFSVERHYFLVSMLRNLIYNSVEAMEGIKNGYIRIIEKKNQNKYIFTVSDNGTGIKKEDMDYIFTPGFSTKFNEDTGDICRGLGLTHVRDILNNVFLGNISVESDEGKGTKFTIIIDEKELGGFQE